MQEARFYSKKDNQQVQCYLCAHYCLIGHNERGKCGVRENRRGLLWSLVYGRPVAQHIDAVEKKPLYHFQPGSLCYSIGTVGCNFHCLFCQNADIAHGPKKYKKIEGFEISPEEIVSEAVRTECASIAYTYTEPTIFLEFALDVAKEARGAGLKNIFITNGYTSPQALSVAAEWMDAANVDLKSFRDRFYVDQCDAHLKPVLSSISSLVEKGVWVEVTTLLIPGLNDGTGELKEMADYLVQLKPDIPWHISAFHPTYKMLDRPSTSMQSLFKARDIAMNAGLHHVYIGNVPGGIAKNTYCHRCGELLIERTGQYTRQAGISNAMCLKCRAFLDGVELFQESPAAAHDRLNLQM